MADIAYLMSFRVPTQNVFQAEVALADLYYSIGEEEFSKGGVETFAIHRVVGDPGAYQIYEQYTNAAAGRHGTGPLVRAAWSRVLARMVAPFERVLLDPLGVFGLEKGIGSDVVGDECWRYTIRVSPEDAGQLEVIFDDIMDAMEIDEFSYGEVKSYTAHRIAGDVGRYVMYEHFTALGSGRHATGANLLIVGRKQMSLIVTPFERLQLEPLFALGLKHAAYGKTAPGSRSSAHR